MGFQGQGMQLVTAAQDQPAKLQDKDNYRLIVFDPSGTAVLLESKGNEHQLPKIEIPQFIRPAQEITNLVLNNWGMSTVFLFSELLEQKSGTSYFAVLESEDGIRQHPRNTNWFTIHHALSNLILPKQERQALNASYRKAVHGICAGPQEPFCRVGWMRGLEEWVQTVIQPLGMELKSHKQLNGCETFSLIRFATTGNPVWFKAVGEPNLREYSISQTLARLFPNYAPRVLATKPEWHGWLMEGAGGASLNEMSRISAWQSAVEALAQLQIASISNTEELLRAGCRDLSTSRLLKQVDPFLAVMANLMKQQTKCPPKILNRNELEQLGTTVKDALNCVTALQLPETLGHSDFNPGNIIFGAERCVFIDWAEAHVGLPFLTFEYFLAHLRKDYSQFEPFEADLRTRYLKALRSIASPTQMAEACLFSPLLAVYAYAVSSNVWRDAERLKIPGFQGYLRSLTRRMKQEADLLQRRRVECPN
jgi:hypothetical protein